MDQKEIKTRLKEAKEAIKTKDFTTAMNHCKVVLKNDLKNYNALVLFGAALQEKDQAPKVFKKAIEINPNQMSAWQGIIVYYENHEQDQAVKRSELFQAYKQLFILESDENKFKEICHKLCSIYLELERKELDEEFLNIIEQKLNENSMEQKKYIFEIIIKILFPIKDLPVKWINLLEKSLNNLIANSPKSEQMDNYKKYFKILYKQKKISLLIEKLREVIHECPENETTLQWICKVYYEELFSNPTSTEKNLQPYIKKYYEQLLQLKSNSFEGNLAKATDCFAHKEYLQSIELANLCLSLVNESLYCHILLSKSYFQIHNYIDANKYVNKVLEMKSQTLNKEFQNQLKLLRLQSLILQEDEEKLKGLKLFEKLDDIEPANEINLILARGHVFLNNILEAETKLLQITEKNKYIESINLIRILILKKEGKLEEALSLINSSFEKNLISTELILQEGLIKWDLGLKKDSLLSFQKVVKLDPYNFICFVYFGKYYQDINPDKAMRCYQKALQINKHCVEAGLGLSDIYRKQKNEENNLEFLKEVTSTNPRAKCKWAWLRLGLQYHDKGQLQEAMDSLRSAIRADPDDSHCWEALADVYLERGACSAALKAYQRVLELDPSALYPALQIGTINQTLGLYKDSVLQFKQVIEINPRYVPALKGLGESHFLLAKHYISKHLLGLCKDECQKAFDTLTLAAEEQKDLVCIWKLLGDVCLLLSSLPSKWAYLHVSEWIIAESDISTNSKENELIEKNNILQLSSRCYCRGLSLNQSNAFLWHDLALSYYYQADQEEESYMQWALSAIQRSLSIESENWFQWNLLGVIASHSEIDNFKLAQHAFIKAIQVQNNNPIPWSNLGVLYLNMRELKLANQAFQMAQKTDPYYMESWIGQALIAEATGHHDAMDLFRHTMQLGFNLESCLGYADFVVTTIRDTQDRTNPSYLYSIEKMYALPVVCDRVLWYTDLNPKNAQALNTLGLLFERQKLYRNAQDAFEKSLDLLYDDSISFDPKIQTYKDMVHHNCGRIQIHLGNYEDSINHYQQIKESNFHSQCGLALAFLKAEKYQDSYNTYNTALYWLVPDDGFKSHVLVAMAGICYKLQAKKESTQLLGQCIQLKPPSVCGMLAACALGILNVELELSEIALDRLKPFADMPEHMTDIANLNSFVYTLEDASVKAVNSLSAVVHRHPYKPSLWLALALLLLHHYQDQNPESAARCARIALTFGRNKIDVSKVMSLVALGELLNSHNNNGIKSLRAAEKAVFLFPYITENWAVLLASVLARCLTYRSQDDARWLAQTIDHVRRRLPPDDSVKGLTKWLSHNERKAAQLCQELNNC